MALEDNLRQILSEEARQRVVVLSVLRKHTYKPEHLETLRSYNPINSHKGLPKLRIDDPVEDSCVLARACHELLFDFDQAARIAAGQGDTEAFFAYQELADLFGCPYTAREEFERYEQRREQEKHYENAKVKSA